jgi:hypothetical protein
MNSPTTPSTPGKCSSLIAKPMMLKFWREPSTPPKQKLFKFDPNPMVDLGGTII